jgi:hypothetical protein
MRVYRWDLDKTYLDTDFESFRGVVRAATEPAHRKRVVPGAGALLRALSVPKDTRVTVISGSPKQMRRVLSEKLKLDGVEVDELVLKDSIGHVKRGRFRAIKGQIGYKLPALLRARAATPLGSSEVLFGDDVEADALVYSLYADAIAGRIGAAQVSRVMERAGAYPDEIDHALNLLATIEPSDAVEKVFIRQERGVAMSRFEALGPRVVPVRSWWQAALVLLGMGHLSYASLEAVMIRVFEEEGRDPWLMGALAQDVVRRGCVDSTVFDSLIGPDPLVTAVRSAVSAVSGQVLVPSAAHGGRTVDYLGLISGGGWGRHGQLE